MRKRIVCLLLFCTLLFCACNEPAPGFLTRRQAEQDWAYLWKTLRENYPFFPAIQHADLPGIGRGLTPNAVISHYSRELTARMQHGRISLTDFYAVLSDALAVFRNIGHLEAVDPAFYELIYNVYVEAYDLLEDTDAYSYLRDIATAPHTIEAYALLRAQQSETQDAFIAQPLSPPDAPFHLTYEGSIAILQIPQMTLESWDTGSAIRALHNALADCRDAQHLIIDIRGNTGGNARLWQQGVVQPLLQEPVTLTLAIGMMDGEVNRLAHPFLKEPSSLDFDALQALLPQVNPESIAHLSHLFLSNSTFSPENSVGFGGRIWLLVDERVYSAADAFAVFCKHTGFATIVGTRTGGSGMGGEPLLFTLPHSGLLVRYDCTYGFFADGACNAVNGTAPDIPAAPSEDALEACLAYIRQ